MQNLKKRRVKIKKIQYRQGDAPYYAVSVEDIESELRFKYTIIPEDFDAMINTLYNRSFKYSPAQRKQISKAMVGSIIDVEDRYEMGKEDISKVILDPDEYGQKATQQCVNIDQFPFYESELEAKYEKDNS